MNLDRIQHLLEQARKRRLLVVGDVMLDEFVWGKVSRISPEAPVPVVEVQRESSYPGGAANVARNLREFCATVHISGLVGQDAGAKRLADLLREEGIATDGIIEAEHFETIVKTRIIARQQQVVRVDREKKGALPAEVVELAAERISALLPEVDAIIFEDYNKGFLTQELVDRVSAVASAAGKVITADPNPGNRLEWRGVTTIKPNRSEAFAMAGRSDTGAADEPLKDEPLLEVGQILLEKLGAPSLLITLGEHGMILFDRASPPYHTPTRAREVFDVSGAGDTAIALFTLALSAGATLQEAAEISNHASGVVVGKLGTATLTVDELLASLEKDHA
ncbi:D-beta-D-heptose 7-phosphate kinase [Terrimicrobium sacchariphilum]|uniref:D-beta-D-heptose 7-phosphate kinase n=1 Tax=Terrimicrobium sacchariphilum TaxID=690879 RepID=A0A146G5Z4_TERSA|nr:PfkB family carbohydrate kinase [Terrimicrobium sacchariphilum]GAT32813.1 D-beta-D-heptose 7-phosphate kinase [Terrimicrobium sacchariphilum]